MMMRGNEEIKILPPKLFGYILISYFIIKHLAPNLRFYFTGNLQERLIIIQRS